MTRARDVSSRGGLTQVIPTSVAVGSGSGSVGANGTVTFTGASSIAVDGCFTSTYSHYKVIFFISEKSTSAQAILKLRTAGSTIGGVSYRQQSQRSYGTNIDSYPYSSGTSEFVAPGGTGNGQSAMWSMEFINPANASVSTFWNGQWFAYDGGNFVGNSSQGAEYTSASRDGFVVSLTGTMGGNVRIYGYNNG